MQWVCYVGGRGRKGDLLLVQIALADDPFKYVAFLATTQPYKLELLAYEAGNEDVLEERRSKYPSLFRNGWVKPTEALVAYIEGLPTPDLSQANLKKVCVDFTPQEFQEIEDGVDRLRLRTKTRLIRRAVKFYLALTTYKAKGWTVQVIRGGNFKAFPDLDDIELAED